MVVGLTVAVSACGASSYEAKNADGIKFIIKKEDVRCQSSFTPAVTRGHTHYVDSYSNVNAYSETRCKANGITKDLTGRTYQWTGSYRTCKKDEVRVDVIATSYKFDGIPGQRREGSSNIKRAITGRQPRDINCASALHFGKYTPD